jgi:uncharacterized membrane protein YfcA
VIAHLSLALIFFAGGLLHGVTGFGALIVMVPMMALFMDMNTAIPLGVLCGCALQIFSSLVYRAQAEKKTLLHMLLASLPGVWLGSSLLLHMPDVWLKALLGTLVICYVLWQMYGKLPPPVLPPSTAWVWVAGFLAGVFGGAFGIIGPPVVIYVTRTGWPPNAIRGFLGMLCALLFGFIAILQHLRGIIGPEVWQLAAWTIPVSLAACMISTRMTARMVSEHYMRLIFLLLFLMGLSLCWPAVHVLAGR